MKRTILLSIVAVISIAGAFILAIVGIRAASHPAVVPGLTCLGELTLEAFESRIGENDEDEPYTIYYHYIDEKYGEIVYANAVGEEDYYSYLYDLMRANAAQEGEIPAENDEVLRKASIRRYVYVYPENGRYEAVFQDRYMGLTDVSDLIDDTPKVSSTYYYIVAGILLISGAYLLFLALTGTRSDAKK